MNSDLSRKIALVLIIAAVAGTEVSYHLTLESRFNTIEEKLQQQSATMAQMQDSIDTLTASKTQSVSDLNKQLLNLQSTFEPLGKNSQAQADALTQLRAQIATLQQAQTTQQDAQKKLSDYIAQLEENVKKARAEAAAAAAKPAPAPAAAYVPPAAPATPNLLPPPVATSDLMTSPGAVSHAGMIDPPAAPEPAPAPRALPVTAPNSSLSGVDLRPADSTVTTNTGHSNRALPVGASLSSKN